MKREATTKKTGEKQRIEVKLVRLNNSSRRGTYIYVKGRKGKGRYYKYENKAAEIEAITKYYKDKYLKKKETKKKTAIKRTPKKYKKTYESILKGEKQKKRTPISRGAEQYLRKIKKKPEIKSILKKGQKRITTYDILKKNSNEIRKQNEKLLKTIIAERKFREEMSREENMSKIRNYINHKITYADEKGNILMTSYKHGITLKELAEELKEAIRGEAEEVNQDNYDNAAEAMNKAGHSLVDVQKEGRIKYISVETTYKRA